MFDEFQEIAGHKQEGLKKRQQDRSATRRGDRRPIWESPHIVLKNDDYEIQDVMFGKWIQTF